jgi:hypothetical protein
MPLLYGEGEKAFARLQETILNTSEDQSLFAWSPSRQSNTPTGKGTSFFAQHPREFASSRGIFPTLPGGEPATLTSKGIRIELPILYMRDVPLETSDSFESISVFLAILYCVRLGQDNAWGRCAIFLRRHQADALTHTYVRHESEATRIVTMDYLRGTDVRKLYLRRHSPTPAMTGFEYVTHLAVGLQPRTFNEARAWQGHHILVMDVI